jgi:hypothetical protein
MATTKSSNRNKALLDYAVYAPLGAAKSVADQVRDLSVKAWDRARDQRQTVVKTYRELAERGEKLATSIRRSTYTQRAVDQAKQARSNARSAWRSVRKAASSTADAGKATAEATRQAAKKVS